MAFFGLGKKKPDKKETGIIGRYYENDMPVIVKFDSKLPKDSERSRCSILTVVSWKYEESKNNGLPLANDNSRMILLEEALDNCSTKSGVFRHAYSRTGNNLKELVYYATDQEGFLGELNKALVGHDRYPIEITFYNDKEWTEMKELINNFKK